MYKISAYKVKWINYIAIKDEYINIFYLKEMCRWHVNVFFLSYQIWPKYHRILAWVKL